MPPNKCPMHLLTGCRMQWSGPTPAVAEGCCEQRDRPLVHPSLVHSAQLLGLQPRLLGDVLQEAQGHQEAGILLIVPVARVLTCKDWPEMVTVTS